MKPFYLWLMLQAVACAVPTAPTGLALTTEPALTAIPPVKPTTWALSGQSNAVGLKPAIDGYAPIVGVQQNSTPIKAWAVDGPLWPALAASLPAATAFIWWQGESDVPGARAVSSTYRAELVDLMTRVRAIAGPIPIVLCSANSNWAYDALRAVQQDEATAHGWIYVPSNDLPQPGPGEWDVPAQMVLPATFPVGASPHLSQDGYRQMAARVAAALKE